MKFQLPPFPLPFEFYNHNNKVVSGLQKETLNRIEEMLNQSIMKDVVERMHKFYVEGQEDFRSVLPQLISYGSMTQELYDSMQKDYPNESSSSDFTQHLLYPFCVHLPSAENYKPGTFGLSCECTWDEEHGVGVWFENWKITRLGFGEAGYS